MNESDQQREHDEFLVSQYIDDTLDDSARREFERRLATDADLVKLLGEYRVVDAAIGSWAEQPPDLDWSRFEADVRRGRERIDAVGQRTRRIYKLFVPLAAAASIVFAFSLWPSAPSIDATTVAVVAVDAPETIAETDAEIRVTYGYRETEIREYESAPAPGFVLAKAAVGGHVRWPAIDG